MGLVILDRLGRVTRRTLASELTSGRNGNCIADCVDCITGDITNITPHYGVPADINQKGYL